MKVQVRRSLSSKIPHELLDGNLELGVISYDPDDERLISKVIYTDRLAFVVSPQAPLGQPRRQFRSRNWGRRPSSRTTCFRRTAKWCCASSSATRCRCNMDVEMPTIETIRKLVQRNEGVAFLPRMCVEQEIEQGLAREVRVKEMHVERKIRLIYPTRRALSHAAKAFLEVVRESTVETAPAAPPEASAPLKRESL